MSAKLERYGGLWRVSGVLVLGGVAYHAEGYGRTVIKAYRAMLEYARLYH